MFHCAHTFRGPRSAVRGRSPAVVVYIYSIFLKLGRYAFSPKRKVESASLFHCSQSLPRAIRNSARFARCSAAALSCALLSAAAASALAASLAAASAWVSQLALGLALALAAAFASAFASW